MAYGTNVSTPFLASYRDRLVLGPSATQAIFVAYVGGILAMLFIAGQLSDRFGRRRVLIPALALSTVGSVLLILGRNNFALLLTGRIVLGAASGSALGVGSAWMQELLGRGRELRAALLTTVVTYGGFGLGPAISTIWEPWLPHPLVWPFIIHIIASLAMIPLISRCPETVPAATPERKRDPGHSVGSVGLDGGRSVGPDEALGVAHRVAHGLAHPEGATSTSPAEDPLPPRQKRWRPELALGVPHRSRRQFWWVLAPLAVFVFAFPSTGFSLFPLLVADSYDGSDVVLTGVAGVVTPWAGLAARPYLRRVDVNVGLVHGAAVGSVGYVLGTTAWASGIWPLVWVSAMCLGAASGILSTCGLTHVASMSDDSTRGALSSTYYLLAYLGMSTPLVITAVGSVAGIGPTLVAACAIATMVAATTPLRRRLATTSIDRADRGG